LSQVYVKEGLTVFTCDKVGNFNQYVKFAVGEEGRQVYFYLVYRPPKRDRENMAELITLIQEAESRSIMIGDFNCPGVDWETGRGGDLGSELAEAALENKFSQMVDFPTHIKGNLLDLVLTNIPEKVLSICEEGRLGKSDHSIIMLELSCKNEKVDKREEVRNWNRANWNNIREGIREEYYQPKAGQQGQSKAGERLTPN